MKPSQTILPKAALSPRLDRQLPKPLLQWIFKPLAWALPGVAAIAAERVFITPPHYATPAREREVLSTGHRFNMRHGTGTLAAWSWGDGPTVFLLHGWGGRGGQYFKFVPALVAAGFSVVLFDAPAHGETAGRQASLRDFGDALISAIASAGPAHAIISHSLGAAAAALALKHGAQAEKAIFIAPPLSPEAYVSKLARRLALGESAHGLLKARVAKGVGLPWEELSLTASANLMQTPSLIVADTEDESVPFAGAEKIAKAWPDAQLLRTEGWGHHRLLRSPEVIRKIIGFIAQDLKSVA